MVRAQRKRLGAMIEDGINEEKRLCARITCPRKSGEESKLI